MRSPGFPGQITPSDFNPWWGCTKIQAPGGAGSACDFCYAEANAKRWGFDIWGKDAPRRELSETNWNGPLKWNRLAVAAERQELVFCASMADVFEARSDLDSLRLRLWDLIAATPNLTWQLLTKRPENISRMVPAEWVRSGCPRNVWLGTTVEDQRSHDLRIGRLLEVRAVVHFVSYEPALAPVTFNFRCPRDTDGDGNCPMHLSGCPTVDWVIVGGESGGNARPFDLGWARSVRDQCAAAGVAFFQKQMGTLWAVENGFGRAHGDRPEDWPTDLRVREFPAIHQGRVTV